MGEKLGVMANYRGVMAVIIEAAENKGVRFDISDFSNEDIESLNQDVVIFRGKAHDFLHSLFEGTE